MKTCLVLMRDRSGGSTGFADSLTLFECAVRPAIEEVGLECERVDPHDFGRNDSYLFNLIESADAMIVDASANSLDYLYSLGVRHALTDKITLILVDEPQYTAPFDFAPFPDGVLHVTRKFGKPDCQQLQRQITRRLSASLTPDESYSPVRKALEETQRVFLSYAHRDSESVRAVDQWLRDRGARVDLDERNFIGGRDIREEIIRHVKRAGKVVCLYSKSSADRYYPKLERRLTEEIERELHESGQSRAVLLYFRLDDTPLPTESSHRLAINAWEMSFAEACGELWRHLLEEAAEPHPIDLSKYETKPPW